MILTDVSLVPETELHQLTNAHVTLIVVIMILVKLNVQYVPTNVSPVPLMKPVSLALETEKLPQLALVQVDITTLMEPPIVANVDTNVPPVPLQKTTVPVVLI